MTLVRPKSKDSRLKVRIRKSNLAYLLAFWGARGRSDRWPPRQSVKDASEGQLWDWYEKAKSRYRQMISKAHPDRGGDCAEAATLNAAWTRTESLFQRLKIGVFLCVLSVALTAFPIPPMPVAKSPRLDSPKASEQLRSFRIVRQVQPQLLEWKLPDVVPTNYYWLLESSADLKHWTAVMPSNTIICVEWDNTNDPTVIGYNVYWGVSSRLYTNSVFVTTNSAALEVPIYPLYLAADSENAFGGLSDLSNEAFYWPGGTVPGIPTARTRTMAFWRLKGMPYPR